MSKQFVRCCEETGRLNLIWFDDSEPCFRYIATDDVWEYCPWCGILLDVNLYMSE